MAKAGDGPSRKQGVLLQALGFKFDGLHPLPQGSDSRRLEALRTIAQVSPHPAQRHNHGMTPRVDARDNGGDIGGSLMPAKGADVAQKDDGNYGGPSVSASTRAAAK